MPERKNAAMPDLAATTRNGDRAGVKAANSQDPLWYRDAVIYQLHIKSFFDSNDDGIGDFAGLTAKLDYIADLGVDTIWVLPFYPSPRRDDGYDIADYRGIHPDYGTMQDFRRFMQAAHDRGLRVITELVVNHTSDQHPWFQKARAAKPGSAARDYYVWSDTDQKYPETRIIFLDTEKSNWTWDPVANAYFWHRFYSHQPDLNFDNPLVLRAVLAVMKYWLEQGVDGLRLDAVPYLVEREGTNNENLPETHEILKRIRAHLDEHFEGRMLLAEANQWPEDAQEYFGNGDECHMSFHFPLMPRMYMAIAKEDRLPITDIMRQTPAIPEGCQWAVFLRNHDELTLEMVTSSERDYLWETYASERRARINLGIRRRLAPLMERDRRRIELMNSLLFSMPGTPVIYYGDEIGMGDNIHLGDRDGVRTPMQWSPDRNGGFSRADPERLVLPAIMGSLYGFEAVNVESQRRDPHSLLNWTRRILAVRRQYHAFGRGSLRFLFPGNRKILAYLREYEKDGPEPPDQQTEKEIILCVANLSRAPQPVELHISEFSGYVPVEMIGGTSFPAIGELPYLLTLPPYGFYWFSLSRTAQPPSWHTSMPEQMPEFITLVVSNKGDELTPGSRQAFDREVLPAYLSRRRWFAGKDEAIDEARVANFVELDNASHLYYTEIEVKQKSNTVRYAMPVAVLWDVETLQGLPLQLALARLRRGPRPGFITDAFAVPDFARVLIEGLRTPNKPGPIRYVPEAGLSMLDELDIRDIRWLSAEQSNSSLIIAGTAVLKLIRRVAPGINPEVEVTRHLTRAGFANTTQLLGEVQRVSEDGQPCTFAVLQSFIGNQGDGWSWTLDTLRRTVGDAALTDESGEDYEDDLQGYNAFAGALGRRLAELHAVLANDADDPAFQPEVATEKDCKEWVKGAKLQLEAALTALQHAKMDDVSAPLAERVRTLANNVLKHLPDLAVQGVGSLRTRVHGDFHLGQVLVSGADAYLIDFEGEPAKTLDQRRTKTCPMRDVAGLLRSFDYAAGVTASDNTTNTPTVEERRLALLNRFRSSATTAFLDGYRSVAYQAAKPWVKPEQETALLDLFLMEKAAYEVCYEAANRPHWIGLPLRGLAEILERLGRGA